MLLSRSIAGVRKFSENQCSKMHSGAFLAPNSTDKITDYCKEIVYIHHACTNRLCQIIILLVVL